MKIWRHQLKGKSKAVQVHKFLSAKELPRKIHRLHGLRAELIGRKAEMARLTEAVDNLRQGKGSVFSIIGTAGTGKSRLVEEFKASLDLKAIQWLEGNSFAYAHNIPYFPLIDLISKAIRIDEGDSPETVKEKLESSLEVLIENKRDVAPYIGSLYALDYPEIEEVSPEFWKAELQKAILMVLTALAQRAATVVCLEDLHWADPSTIELVHFLLSEIRHSVLFICVYRPTVSIFSTHQTTSISIPYHELHLRDLSLSEAESMVESLLSTEAIPKDLKRFIQNKVEGNPFYLEEAINSLIESNNLVPENGDWKVNGPITETEISATIQGVIAARVDRLKQESKRILQEASVIGRSFYYDILIRISEIRDNIDRSLSGLERFDLIKTKSIQPYLEYIFKHALTQEVVYNGLLKKERREIHERIGYVIEELFKDRLPEFYETLAFHFENGHSIDKAVHYLMRSGEKSLKRYAIEESDQFYKNAYTLLINKSKNSNDSLFVALIIQWALVFYYRGDFKGLSDLLESHEETAGSLDNKSNSGLFYAWLGFVLQFRARHQESYQFLHKALKIGNELNDDLVVAYACCWLTFTCADLGLTEEAISHGQRAHKLASLIHKDQYLYFKSLGGLGHAYLTRGSWKNWKRCEQIGDLLIDYGRKNSNIRSSVVGHITKGHGYTITRNFPLQIDSYKKAVEVSVDPFYSFWAKIFLGFSFVMNGKPQNAEEPLNEVLAYTKEFGCESFQMIASSMLGLVRVMQGHMSEGVKMLEEVRQFYIDKELRGIIEAGAGNIGKFKMTTHEVKRKLAAILTADVKGYSRLMSEDEVSTIRTLTAYKGEMSALIKQHRGRVVDAPGDNLLAEFASVVDAVQCAVEIQREIAGCNEEPSRECKMSFRIGINLGDVVEEDGRIYGDGVNIAARIESLCEGGGVCLSGTAFEHVENKLDLEFEDLGEREVKNMKKPVRVYRLITAGKSAETVNTKSLELPDKPSIAVLPLDNMSGDPSQEYFCDGLTEEIISCLSKVSGLFVIARNSVFVYKGKQVKVQQIGEELGVRYVLEGSVRNVGDRVRVTSQLIETTTDHHLWAERFDRNMEDIFALQDEITKQILISLQVKLTEGEQARLYGKGTDNLEAYLKHLQGHQYAALFNKESNFLARQMFEEAIALDPNYAMAYIYLAIIYVLDVWLGISNSPKESLKHALELVKRRHLSIRHCLRPMGY